MSGIPKPKKKRFYKRWWFWLLVVVGSLVAIAVIGGSVAYQRAQQTAYAYLEKTITVEDRQLKKTITTNGEVTSDNTTHLFVSRPGTVTEVNYNVGDEVVKDDIVVKTDGGSLPDEEIKAPFDGRVLAIHTFEGDAASLTVPVVEIGFRSNHIEFIASESEVINLRVDQHATLTIPSFNNGRDSYEGEVTFVDVQKQTIVAGTVSESGYLVKVSADDLPDELERIVGLSIDVVVDVYETDEVASIEPSAIQYDEDTDPFVYLPPVVNDNFIQSAAGIEDITELLSTQKIEIGFEGDQYFEVESGLESGDEALLYIPSNGPDGLF